jgi:hypothetical protein
VFVLLARSSKCAWEYPVFTSQREKWADPQIVALVELDRQAMRVHILLSREAIRERLRELEHPRDQHGERQGIEDAPNHAITAGPKK